MSVAAVSTPTSGIIGKYFGEKPVLPVLASYQNAAVIARFARDYNRSPQEAEQCFEELKNFLAEVAFAGPVEPPSKDVDHMWHTFLLFTRDYAEFCKKCFGKFIHHVPTTGTTD